MSSANTILQFEELKSLLSRYAGSAAGRALVLSISPEKYREAIETALAEAGEAIAYLRETQKSEGVRLRFDQVRDLEPHVRALQVEGIALQGSEILDLFQTLSLAGEYRGVLF